jgi:hypothetical protein
MTLLYLLNIFIGNPHIPTVYNFLKLFRFLGGGFRTPHTSKWLPYATWLILPLSIVLMGLVYQFRNRSRTAQSSESPYLATMTCLVAIILFIQIVLHQWPAQLLYFHQTLPIYFVCLGALLNELINRLTRLQFAGAFALILIAGIVTLKVHDAYAPSIVNFEHPLLMLALLSVGGLVAISGIEGLEKLGALVFLLAFFLLNIFGFPKFQFSPPLGLNHSLLDLNSGVQSAKENFLATLAWTDFIDRLDPERTHYIWYNQFSHFGGLFLQFSAPTYLYQERQLNREFPSTHPGAYQQGNSGGTEPSDGMKILIISDKPDSATIGKSAMEHERKLTFVSEETDVFEFKNLKLYATKAILSEKNLAQ